MKSLIALSVACLLLAPGVSAASTSDVDQPCYAGVVEMGVVPYAVCMAQYVVDTADYASLRACELLFGQGNCN